MKMLTSETEFKSLKVRDLVKLQCSLCSRVFEKKKREVNKAISKNNGWLNHCSKNCLFNSRPSNIVERNCTACNILFTSKDYENRKVCSSRCAALNSAKARKENNKINITCVLCGESFVTSKNKVKNTAYLRSSICKNCFGTTKKAKTSAMACSFCQKEFTRHQKDLKTNKHGKRFCSKECNARFFSDITLVSKTRKVSLAEILLADLIYRDYPSLDCSKNDRITLPSKLELDLFFPAINLAIEINGPTHYRPIYGYKALEKRRLKDKTKTEQANLLGITLLVIDISKLGGKGVTINFINSYYQEIVKPLLISKIEPH